MQRFNLMLFWVCLWGLTVSVSQKHNGNDVCAFNDESCDTKGVGLVQFRKGMKASAQPAQELDDEETARRKNDAMMSVSDSHDDFDDGGVVALKRRTTQKKKTDARPVKVYCHTFHNRQFTEAEQEAICTQCDALTLEKRHARNVYGSISSIEGITKTAETLKAREGCADLPILMYWNTVVYYNLFECEADIADNPSWLMPSDFKESVLEANSAFQGFYNYSSEGFRQWWVDCAVNSVKDSDGALDGIFFDGLPKLSWYEDEGVDGFALADQMMAEVESQIGTTAMPYNGYYLPVSSNTDNILAGYQELSAVHSLYDESFDRAMTDSDPEVVSTVLADLWAGISQTSTSMVIAHLENDDTFNYCYCCFLLVTPANYGYVLGNDDNNYRSDKGGLDWHDQYDSVQIGNPTGPYSQDGYVLTREFEYGTVVVDISTHTGTITDEAGLVVS